MKAIVSVDANWAIGLKGSLLVRIPEDMRFFKNTTLGGTVIMGRETFLSLPRHEPLPNRHNIILTTRHDFSIVNADVCNTMEELLKKLCDIPPETVFVIGGESVYRQLLGFCDEIIVTKLHRAFEADRHFPNLDEAEGWNLVKSEGSQVYNGLEYSRDYYRNSQVAAIKNS